jgi:site-specific recombinase XerD
MAKILNMRPDSEVEPQLQNHLHHLRKHNQRPRSIRERRLTILRVGRNIGHEVAVVTRVELVELQDRRAALSPAGMHNEIVHVAQYLKWLVAAELRTDDPPPALVRPRHVNQMLPRPMADARIIVALATGAPAAARMDLARRVLRTQVHGNSHIEG